LSRWVTLRQQAWLATVAARTLIVAPSNLRHVKQWIRDGRPWRNAVRDRHPWITYGASRWLDRHVKPTFHVFEFSSGGSTLFFVDRCASVVAIEHDHEWCERVRQLLGPAATRCDLRHVAPSLGHEGTPPCPSARYQFLGASFSDYVNTLDEFPDQSFDLISIDGRFRVACAAHAKAKVKPGGVLMLDNSDRDDYRDVFSLLSEWRRVDFYGLGPYRHTPWQTSVWESPSEGSDK
jgi:hypothetical protein